jgi:hypothetical protein
MKQLNNNWQILNVIYNLQALPFLNGTDKTGTFM